MGTDARRRIAVSIGSPHKHLPRNSFVTNTHYHLRGGFIVKIKKRMLSFALAVLLIVTMAIPASAATVTGSGSYGNGTYATSSNCYTDHWSCVIELSSYSDSYFNYLMRVDVITYKAEGNGTGTTKQFTLGDESFRIASNYDVATYKIFAINAHYYINNNQVGDPVWVRAS